MFTQHLGFSSGLLPRDALWWNQGETGQMVALWRPPQVWPVALQREAFKPPARLRLPMPGLVFVCSPAGPPGSTQRWSGRRPRPAALPDARLQRLRGRAGLSRKPQFPEEVGRIPESFFQSYFSGTGDSRNRSKKHPEDLHALWEEIDGRSEYPVEDLVRHGTVAQVIAASQGRRGYGYR